MLRLFVIVASMAWSTIVLAQDVLGLSLPLSGRFAPVAERIELGAQAAMKDLVARGRDVRLVLVDDGCDMQRVEETTKRFDAENVSVIGGPVCFEIARALAANLNGVGSNEIPVIALNTRHPLLARARTVDELPIFELGQGPDAEAQAVVDLILPRFEGRPFAILDDGSVYGRGLAEQVALLATHAGLEPIASADFRPLQTNQLSVLRRLQRSGVQAVFLAANPEDVVIIAEGLQALNYDWLIGTAEASRLLPFTQGTDSLPAGLMMVRPADLSARNAEAFLKQSKDADTEVEDSILLGYALVQIMADAAANKTNKLKERTIETILGPLTFADDGRASPAPFSLYEWRDGTFEAVAR
ncbi:MAG: penicillin-binding protein activator [Ahrensia sp.]|nr:penicillin-binding protein activator [Ahrensia sp.]